MQPINLLPPYIYDKQKKTALVGVWGAIAAILLIGCVAWGLNLSSKVSQAQSEKDQAQSFADQWSKTDGAITQANQAVADERQKLTFITNAKKWNDTWPEIYGMMRDWTSPQILLRAMSLDPAQHRTISLSGFADNERKIIQWWMLLRNNPRLQSPNFALPPHGYAPVNAQANAGGFGGSGFGGGRAGMMADLGMMGVPGMPGGPGGRPGMMGQMGPMGPGMMGPGGFAGRGGFGGGARGNVGQAEIEGRRGIEFTATAMLREPFAGGIPLPTWPPAGGVGAAGAGAGAGFPGGFRGGMMPPGMMGPGGPGMMPPGMMGPGGPGMMGPGGPAGRTSK
jgi:hypothetical protein